MLCFQPCQRTGRAGVEGSGPGATGPGSPPAGRHSGSSRYLGGTAGCFATSGRRKTVEMENETVYSLSVSECQFFVNFLTMRNMCSEYFYHTTLTHLLLQAHNTEDTSDLKTGLVPLKY